jgi:hypothetical protein
VILSVAKIRHFAIFKEIPKKSPNLEDLKKKRNSNFLENFGRFLVFSF